MNPRVRFLRALFVRAGGKRVFAYCSLYASCAEVVGGKVPEDADRICVEGDANWVAIPAADEADQKERAA